MTGPALTAGLHPISTLAVERVMDAEEALTLWRDVSAPACDPTPALLTNDPIVVTLDGAPIALQTRLPEWATAVLRANLLRFPILSGVYRGAGLRNRAQVFGYLAKNPLLSRNTCRSSVAAQQAPEAHAAICGLADTLASILRDVLPDQWEANRAAVAEVLPDWLLPGGLWTSGVVNLTSVLPYHRDRNNFDAWSAMPVIRRGVRGGYLHFPEIDLTAPCRDGDVLMFNGQAFMHGVTPIRQAHLNGVPRPGQPDATALGYRYSCVYYPVKKMRSCLAAEIELAEAQRRRTQLETTLIERQRAQGYLRGAEEIAAEVDALGVHGDEEEEDD